MPVTIYYPPVPAKPLSHDVGVFLAGTIDNGDSHDWQAEVISAIDKLEESVSIYNPRRPEWDATWQQDISNTHFRKQVEWELEHIELADIVVVNFLPGSQSPITLLELGFIAGRDDDFTDVVVCCPPGFWRRGNVQVVCARHDIPLYDDMSSLCGGLTKLIEDGYI